MPIDGLRPVLHGKGVYTQGEQSSSVERLCLTNAVLVDVNLAKRAKRDLPGSLPLTIAEIPPDFRRLSSAGRSLGGVKSITLKIPPIEYPLCPIRSNSPTLSVRSSPSYYRLRKHCVDFVLGVLALCRTKVGHRGFHIRMAQPFHGRPHVSLTQDPCTERRSELMKEPVLTVRLFVRTSLAFPAEQSRPLCNRLQTIQEVQFYVAARGLENGYYLCL
jgi:hypothetical protein